VSCGNVFLSKRRNRDHLAMSALTAQPAEKAAREKLRVERFGSLRPNGYKVAARVCCPARCCLCHDAPRVAVVDKCRDQSVTDRSDLNSVFTEREPGCDGASVWSVVTNRQISGFQCYPAVRTPGPGPRAFSHDHIF
jgi:hypothetical protein